VAVAPQPPQFGNFLFERHPFLGGLSLTVLSASFVAFGEDFGLRWQAQRDTALA
jgi:hypothetical protein